MKYETPELTPLTPAINAVQGTGTPKFEEPSIDSGDQKEAVAAYADWEE
jgi:hypothetical protein